MKKGTTKTSTFSKKQTKKVVANAENYDYKPDAITFKSGKPAQVKFTPSDNMGCMNEVVFKGLGIDKVLDGKSEVVVNISTDKPGTYNFACGMDMFHGKVVVK